MVSQRTIKQYLHADNILFPLKGKIPLEKNWRENTYSDKYLFSYKGNLAINLNNSNLVIDVDPRNDGDKSFEKLQNDLNISLNPILKTPRGGFHIYLKIPLELQHFKIKKTLKEYPGIDFLSEGSYCLIEGCETKDGIYSWIDDLMEYEEIEAPLELIQFIGKEIEKSNSSDLEDLGDFTGLIGGSSSNWEENNVLKLLSKLDPSMPNDDWVKVGMSLHDWDPLKGLELWENWSRGGDNYNEGETEKRWRSFDIGGGVTLGTISYMAKEVDYDETTILVNNFIDKIKVANEKTLEFDIFPKLRKISFSKINLEKIAKSIQDRFKEILEIKVPIGNVRQLISGVEVVSGEFLEEGKTPEWCKKWVYVNSHASFVHLDHLRIYKTEGFNLINGKFIPESHGGTKQSASRYVADKGYVETMDIMSYLPSLKEQICKIDDNKVLNSFNPRTVPIEAKEFSEKGLEAINLIKKHIKFICSTEENSQIFTQWLAHNIQFPGKQILWSPVIQSIQGTGKSFFGELLRCCLGDRNVGTVSPTQVISDFNGWATGVIVNVLEELRVKGHNRYDAINSLKPLITDRMIQINEKGVKQYMTYNTANYICFTNYKDALPLDHDDRRWWVIFVPVESLSEMSLVVGEDISIYFPKLFDSVRENALEIRKWLLEYPISKEFLAIKQAPMTVHKLSMIATEEASFDGYVELRELIEEGSKYYDQNIISSSNLFEDFLFKNPEIIVNTSQRHRILKKLGYSVFEKPIKLDGKTRRIWTKKILTKEEIKEYFEKKWEKEENFDDL